MVYCRQKQTERENDLEEGEMEENEEQQLPVRGDKWGRNTEGLKYTTGLQDEDLVYASFTSEVHIPSVIRYHTKPNTLTALLMHCVS